MILDVLFAILLSLSFYVGWRKGILYSVISLLAISAGIMIAVHFSFLASIYIDQYFNISPVILPILSFVVVFISVLLVVRLCVFFLEKFLKSVSLHFINKLAGGIVWAFILTLISSVLLWLIDQAGFFTTAFKQESLTFEYIVPIGPYVFDALFQWLPFIQETFEQMNQFFRNASESYR